MKNVALIITVLLGAIACGAEVAPSPGDKESQSPAPTGVSPGKRTGNDSSEAATPGSEPPINTGPPAATAPGANQPPDWSGCAISSHVASASPRTAASEQDVLDVIASQPWQIAHDGTPTVFSASADIEATAAFDVSAATIEPETFCASESPFQVCAKPLFRTHRFLDHRPVTISGITCNPTEPIPRWGNVACKSIHVAQGARFRVRKVREDVHPYLPTYYQVIEIERPVTAACALDEASCPSTNVCIPRGTDSCLFCFGQPENVCACLDGCNTRPNGNECSYSTSPDTGEVGTCKAGICAK